MPPRRLFNARAVSSTGFAKETSLNCLTSVTHFLSKNNKVHVKLEISDQGCFCTLFRCISRALTTPNMELFVTLLNDFQALTNVSKNHILDVEGVLDPSMLLYIKILLQNIYIYT